MYLAFADCFGPVIQQNFLAGPCHFLFTEQATEGLRDPVTLPCVVMTVNCRAGFKARCAEL